MLLFCGNFATGQRTTTRNVQQNLRVFVDETWKYNPDAVARIISAQRWDVKGIFLPTRESLQMRRSLLQGNVRAHRRRPKLGKTYSAVNPLLPDEVKQSYIREGDVSTLNERGSRCPVGTYDGGNVRCGEAGKMEAGRRQYCTIRKSLRGCWKVSPHPPTHRNLFSNMRHIATF